MARPSHFFTLTRHGDDDREFVLPRVERERIAREAIRAAARGARIDEGDIQHILSQTVDQRGLSVTDLMVRAASLAEQYTGRQPFNWRSATPDQITRYLASMGLEQGWRRAMRDAERHANRTSSERDADDGPGSRDYGVLGGDISQITASNFTRSYYHQCGLDYGTFDALRREGFSGQNIINAARDARTLGFRANDRDAMRDHALIDRHSIDARGMNTALQDYQRRMRDDTELNDLIRRRQQGTTDEQRRVLDGQIAARRLEHQRASGLLPRLTNSEDDQRARDAGRRRRDAIDRQHEENLTLTPDRAPDQSISEENSRTRFERSGRELQFQAEIERVVARDRSRTLSATVADVNNVFGDATAVTAVVPPPPVTPPPIVLHRTDDRPPPAPEQPPPPAIVQGPAPPPATLVR